MNGKKETPQDRLTAAISNFGQALGELASAVVDALVEFLRRPEVQEAIKAANEAIKEAEGKAEDDAVLAPEHGEHYRVCEEIYPECPCNTCRCDSMGCCNGRGRSCEDDEMCPDYLPEPGKEAT